MLTNNNLCIVKMNPCNDWTGTWLERILQPLVSKGFVRVVYGGSPVAQVLLLQPCSFLVYSVYATFLALRLPVMHNHQPCATLASDSS
jgi:hypothetical protein